MGKAEQESISPNTKHPGWGQLAAEFWVAGWSTDEFPIVSPTVGARTLLSQHSSSSVHDLCLTNSPRGLAERRDTIHIAA